MNSHLLAPKAPKFVTFFLNTFRRRFCVYIFFSDFSVDFRCFLYFLGDFSYFRGNFSHFFSHFSAAEGTLFSKTLEKTLERRSIPLEIPGSGCKVQNTSRKNSTFFVDGFFWQLFLAWVTASLVPWLVSDLPLLYSIQKYGFATFHSDFLWKATSLYAALTHVVQIWILLFI